MTVLRYLPRFRQAYREFSTLSNRETWSRGDIEALQLDRLNRLWDHAIRHVPYYSHLAADARLPRRFRSLDEFVQSVPQLSKETVRSRRTDFLSDRRLRGFWRRTGGSMGPPTRLFLGQEAHREMLRAKYRFYSEWDLEIWDKFAFLWGHAATLKSGWSGLWAAAQQLVIDSLRNRLRLSVYDLSRDQLRRHLENLRRFAPTALYGYASAVYLLAREAVETGFHCDSLKAVIMTSEPVFPFMAHEVRTAFASPAVIEYGAAECDLIAGQSRDGSLRIREDLVFLETLPRDDEGYDIAITVLNNPSFPLIRYLLGDVTPAARTRPEKGFSSLEGVMGRNNDFLVSRGGRRIHAAYFIELLKHSGEIGAYSVHQTSDGAVDVELTFRERTSTGDLALIGQVFQDVLDGYPVSVKVVDHVPLTQAGKHRWIVSDMQPD
jgi:phenylacetate-CoA ligase